MILIKSDISQFLTVTQKKLLAPENLDKMVRDCALSVLRRMKRRVFINGQDAENKQIGIYSKGYMVLRTGSFKNAKPTKSKPDAGMFTKGKSATMSIKTRKLDAPRPRYNRTRDPKVVASLTRQMENDLKVVALGPYSYGLGFSNSHDFDKSQWVEATYKRKDKIWALSPDEQKAVGEIVEKYIQDAQTK